jgi:hypothetical protein
MRARSVLRLLVAQGAAVVTATPLTAAACPLRALPEHPGGAWEQATAKAREALASRSGDCAEVTVEVESDFATLAFTTTDGRRAVRVLHGPDELSPALDALLVTLPPDDTALAPSKNPPNPVVDSGRPPDAAPSPASNPVHAIVFGLGGGRVAGPTPLLGPSVLLGAALCLPRWELGIDAQWTPTYANLSDDPSRPAHLAGVAAGLAVGRRTPIGTDVALATGISLSAASQHEGWHQVAPTTGKTVHADSDRGQALVGVYAAAVFPRDAKTRVRSSLSGDVDATHLGDDGAPASGLPALPWWALTLAIGVEGEVL